MTMDCVAGSAVRALAMFVDFAVISALKTAVMFAISAIAIVSQDLGALANYLVMLLFTFGYGYVASLVMSEQAARRRAQAALPAGSVELDSVPPPAIVDAEASESEELAA